jgi:hypothetical protein
LANALDRVVRNVSVAEQNREIVLFPKPLPIAFGYRIAITDDTCSGKPQGIAIQSNLHDYLFSDQKPPRSRSRTIPVNQWNRERNEIRTASWFTGGDHQPDQA